MKIDWEMVVGVLFIAFFCYVIWRGGGANPVGTGQLQRQLNTIGGEVRKQGGRLDNCALTSDVSHLRGELEAMERRMASSAELVAVQGQIAAVNARIGGIEKLAERTDAGVARIEGYFIQKGVGQ